MSWTVACFCGNVFTITPPGRCPICGVSVDDPARDAGHDVPADIVALGRQVNQRG